MDPFSVRPGVDVSAQDPPAVGALEAARITVGVAAGVLAFAFSFASYYTVRADVAPTCPPGLQADLDALVGVTNPVGTAWHGWPGPLATVFALVASFATVASVGLPRSTALRAGAAAAYLVALVAALSVLGVDPVARRAQPVAGLDGCTVTPIIGHGFGYGAALVAIAAGAVVTVGSFVKAGGLEPLRRAAARANPDGSETIRPGDSIEWLDPPGREVWDIGSPPAPPPSNAYDGPPPTTAPGG